MSMLIYIESKQTCVTEKKKKPNKVSMYFLTRYFNMTLFTIKLIKSYFTNHLKDIEYLN